MRIPVGAWMGGPGERSEAGVKGHRSGLPYRFSRLENPSARAVSVRIAQAPGRSHESRGKQV